LATNNRQEPFVYSSLSAQEFFLKRMAGRTGGEAAPTPPRVCTGRHAVVGEWTMRNTKASPWVCNPKIKVEDRDGILTEAPPVWSRI
jgi:hypothetical protein